MAGRIRFAKTLSPPPVGSTTGYFKLNERVFVVTGTGGRRYSTKVQNVKVEDFPPAPQVLRKGMHQEAADWNKVVKVTKKNFNVLSL